jgi:hypothetical protein
MRVGRRRIPSKSIKAPNDGSHSYLAGVRVGEASNPGPPVELSVEELKAIAKFTVGSWSQTLDCQNAAKLLLTKKLV